MGSGITRYIPGVHKPTYALLQVGLSITGGHFIEHTTRVHALSIMLDYVSIINVF